MNLLILQRYKHIHTLTIHGGLFKFILNKYLEKYKYNRPEYINDFYIACDLVCKLLLLVIIIRIQKKHHYPIGRHVRNREEYIGIFAWKQTRHFHCSIYRHYSTYHEELCV